MTARMTAETVVIHVRTVGTMKGWVKISGTASRMVDKIVATAMTMKSKPMAKKPKISKARVRIACAAGVAGVSVDRSM